MKTNMQRVQFDYAAGMPPNPSSIHHDGVVERASLEEARGRVAAVLGGHPDEIIFTSGGTESNNLAILGSLEKGDHAITTSIEHHSVIEPFRELERRGVSVDFVSPDKNGIVDPGRITDHLRPNTKLISVIYANNEIGTIQSISEISKAIKKQSIKLGLKKVPLFHIDACQAPGALPLLVEPLHVDLMTLNGRKISGPTGVGVLFVKRGVKLRPIMFGGGQERGLRPGTENVEGAAAFAAALESIDQKKESALLKIQKIHDYFIKQIEANFPFAKLNGDEVSRLPGNLNISFMGHDAEMLLLRLDAHGINVSTGSACASGSSDSSYVLKAIGLSDLEIKSSLRFTFDDTLTKKDVDKTISELKKAIALDQS